MNRFALFLFFFFFFFLRRRDVGAFQLFVHFCRFYHDALMMESEKQALFYDDVFHPTMLD